MACFWGVVEIGVGNLHRNYTDWEELQYDKKELSPKLILNRGFGLVIFFDILCRFLSNVIYFIVVIDRGRTV